MSNDEEFYKTRIKYLEQTLEELNRVLSALVIAHGGKVKISNSDLFPNYEIQVYTDCETMELVIQARKI